MRPPAAERPSTPSRAACAERGRCVASVGDQPLRQSGRGRRRSPGRRRPDPGPARPPLAAEDQRLLAAFATQVAVAYEQRRLAEAADTASKLAESDRIRAALLNAVSHDLRTPIASAKAAVSSLRSR